MRIQVVASALFCAATLLTGQSVPTDQVKGPASDAVISSTPKAAVFKSDSDFTFTYPADWEVVDTKPLIPVVKLKAQEGAKSNLEKQGADCTQIPLMIRHGVPSSVIVIVVLDFGCVGNAINASDLASTGLGVAKGLTKNFEISEPAYSAYRLGTHDFWIERAQGTSRSHSDKKYSLEITCTMLKKSLACWFALAPDIENLSTLETGTVSLEGESSAVLVPAKTFGPMGH